jgi:hypothetical protein
VDRVRNLESSILGVVLEGPADGAVTVADIRVENLQKASVPDNVVVRVGLGGQDRPTPFYFSLDQPAPVAKHSLTRFVQQAGGTRSEFPLHIGWPVKTKLPIAVPALGLVAGIMVAHFPDAGTEPERDARI